MNRFARSATNIISAVTALAWLIALALNQSARAEFALGFIPARFSGTVLPFAAVPAFLTPVTATLVHAGPIHLGFNLLIFLWCGAAVERVIGNSRTGRPLSDRRLCRRARAVGHRSDRQRPNDRRKRSDQRRDRGIFTKLWSAAAVQQFAKAQSMDQHDLASCGVGCSSADDGLACWSTRISSGDTSARWRLHRWAFAPAATSALEIPKRLACGQSWSLDPADHSFKIWLQQSVKVDDDIFGFSIVHRALSSGAPRVLGCCITVVNPDDIKRREIKVETLRAFDAAAEYQVELAHSVSAIRFAGRRQLSPFRAASSAALAEALAASATPRRAFGSFPQPSRD